MTHKSNCSPGEINDQERLLALLGRHVMNEQALLESFTQLYPECPPAVALNALNFLLATKRIEHTRDGSVFVSLRMRGPLSSGLHP
jgi:hypothetical protein